MKKFFVVFVLCVIFAVFGCVSAQDAAAPELPAIDEAEAADFLGTWYMCSVTIGEDVIYMADMGVVSVLEVNADNTMLTYSDDDETAFDTQYWYMEDGAAYVYHEDGEPGKMYIETDCEDNCLHIDEGGVVTCYDREIAETLGKGEFVADAAVEDFYGEWYLNSFISGDTILPSSLLGMDGFIKIEEANLDFELMGSGSYDLAYDFADGKITFEDDVRDADNKPTGEKQIGILELHDEGRSLLFGIDGATEAQMIFVHQEDLSEGDWGGFLSNIFGQISDLIGE